MNLPDFLTQITTPTPCADNPDRWAYGASRTDRAHAKQTCRTCPVMTACAAWALPRHDEFGIWGATDEYDRRAWRRTGKLPQRRPRQPAVVPGVRRGGCGTVVAYRRHVAAGETCDVCWEALLERVRESDGHGGAAMYRLEVLLDVPRCPECAEWNRAKSASRRARSAVVGAPGALALRGVTELSDARQAPVQRFEAA